MEAAGSSSAEPRAIGPYVLLEVIGSGAQGTVYLAEQRQPVHRRVALKLFRYGLDREARARFEAEWRAMGRMDHTYIAKVFDAGTVPGTEQPYFVMEYVAGLPITVYCDERRIDIAGRLRLLQQVCEAVQHAHHKGVIHRDLKPANVLVAEQDDRPIVKVVDFGLARALDRQLGSEIFVTEEGQIVGTPEYISPEQAGLSRLDIDTRTDIYSLGVLMYELSIGELPFPSAMLRHAGAMEMQRIIRESQPPTLSRRLHQLGAEAAARAGMRSTTPQALSRALGGGLEWIVTKCLEKDRNRRYPSPSALGEDIGRYLADEPVLAGPPSRVYRLRKWLHRHRASVTTMAAIFVGLIVALAVCFGFYRQAERANALYRRLEDLVLLQDLQAREQSLWPELPNEVPRMRQWVADARALAARRSEHAMTLARLDRAPEPSGKSSRFVRQYLEKLVDDLGRLHTELIPKVEARAAAAEALTDSTMTTLAARWQDVSHSLEQDPRFRRGIAPQVGLVPIGPDPDSKLWEFGHPQTGTVPQRGKDGRLVLDASTGLVFVLVPGGTYRRGAQSAQPQEPNYDREASPREGPVEEVTVEPFFVSKYEMTQRQWRRRTGESPSHVNAKTWLYYWSQIQAPPTYEARDADLLPVEKVSWNDCERELSRLGLRLPTETEWEYAARAGCEQPWPMGSSPDGIEKFANVADALAREAGIKLAGTLDVRDGYPASAPVDAFPPNAFGLYDVLGNVWEWVEDSYAETYGVAPTDRDNKVFRGGSWGALPFHVRYSDRQGYRRDNAVQDIGVRPARSLDP